MTGIGFDLQQIDRIVAGPRTPDIGDQRGGNAPLGGNPTELAGGAGVGAGIRQDDVRMFVFGVQRLQPATGAAVGIGHARAQVFEMAKKAVGDASRGLDPEHNHRIGLGDPRADSGEGLFLRQLINIADRIQLHLQRQAGAIGLGLLLRPGVEAVDDAPVFIGRRGMIFQTVFDVVEVTIAELTQAAADGDPAGAGRQRNAIGRFIGNMFPMAQ